jgi:hypothetical protein
MNERRVPVALKRQVAELFCIRIGTGASAISSDPLSRVRICLAELLENSGEVLAIQQLIEFGDPIHPACEPGIDVREIIAAERIQIAVGSKYLYQNSSHFSAGRHYFN